MSFLMNRPTIIKKKKKKEKCLGRTEFIYLDCDLLLFFFGAERLKPTDSFLFSFVKVSHPMHAHSQPRQYKQPLHQKSTRWCPFSLPTKELDFPKGVTPGKFISSEPHTVQSPLLTDDQERGVTFCYFPKASWSLSGLGESFGLSHSVFKCEDGSRGVVVAKSFKYSLRKIKDKRNKGCNPAICVSKKW